MIWLAGSVAYGLGALVWARLFAGHMAYVLAAGAERSYPHTHRGNTGHPLPSQWTGAWCLGLLTAVAWLLLTPLVYFVARFPSDRWSIGEERKAVDRRQRERIADLERELGIS